MDRRGIYDEDERAHIRYCIRQADGAYVALISKTSPTPSDQPAPGQLFANPPADAPLLTPAIFDALFGGKGKKKPGAKQTTKAGK